jgi:predicted RNase H-like nuclease (RuvC/YqgF family)
VPFAGPLLDTISSFALKEAGGAIIDYFDNKKAEHFLKIIQNPDHAKKTAELFARSLTLRYQKDIQSWSPKTIESTATLYSNQIYDLSIKGKIYECEDKPAEDKIETFLAALREVSTKEMTYSCPRPSEQSLKTSVHQNTKTLRQTIAKHEFQVKHASVHLEGVKRQNSGLLEESSKQKEQINALKAEVSFLKTRFEERDEEVASLRNEVASLREIIANWLTPETPVPVAPIKKSTKGKSSFFSKKPREERESSFKPQTP